MPCYDPRDDPGFDDPRNASPMARAAIDRYVTTLKEIESLCRDVHKSDLAMRTSGPDHLLAQMVLNIINNHWARS